MILITGGVYTKTAEIFDPASKKSCALPDLPDYRHDHSQNGNLACGGGGYSSNSGLTCIKWSKASGTWIESYRLKVASYEHVSWETPSGVYLIGGKYSLKNSKLIKSDGTVEDGFNLKYDTR